VMKVLNCGVKVLRMVCLLLFAENDGAFTRV